MSKHLYTGVKLKFHLVLADIEVIHVNERNCIAILMLVKKDADLVKGELYVKPRRFLVQLVVHPDLREFTVSRHSSNSTWPCYLSFAGHWFQDELVRRDAAAFRDLDKRLSAKFKLYQGSTLTRAVNFSTNSRYERPARL